MLASLAVNQRPKTAAARYARLDRILAHLQQLYPNVECALTHRNPWELLVATILSAQCTDVRVNMVTPGLFAKYPTMRDLAHANLEELGQDVRSTGFYNNKAKNIQGAARTILQDFGGQVPQTMEELLTVPGAARKTANVVLGSGFGMASGIVVDTHMVRLANRLDLTKESDPVRIERDLVKIIPQERWIAFSHQMIHHGRGLCPARKPRCPECPISPDCYATGKTE